MSDFMKKPCKHCPFRNDIRPYLTPERAAELAYAAENPYNEFPCHKTFEYVDEDEYGNEIADFSESKECAGFLTLRAQCGEEVPEGFEPSYEICYIDAWDMIQAHEVDN